VAVVLVTGAAGFVGANLVRRLIADGHDVHAVTRPGSDRWRLEDVRREVHCHDVDLTDFEAVTGFCQDTRPAWILHLAAYGAYSSQPDARRMVATNIMGTLHLVQAAMRVGFEVFVNTGSSSEYGFQDHAPRESEPIDPNSDYAATKASATLLCRSIARRHHLRIQTLRLYSVFGPYEEPARLMPTLIVRGLRNELPPLVRPEIAHDYVYIEDVTEAYIRAATQARQEPGEIYNVGSGTQTSIRELVEMARRVLRITAVPNWQSMPDRPGDTDVWVANRSRIRERLGWQPRYSLEAGFRSMVRWFLKHPDHLVRYAERMNRLPT